MAIKGKKFDKSIRLKGTTEAATLEGELRNDSANSRLKGYVEGSEREILTDDQAQTVENKTIDATAATGNNTLKADASDVEYDNGVSGLTATDAQAAIDELKTGLDNQNEASEITYDNTTSGLTATDVQAAVDEVEGRIDTIESTAAVDSFNTRTGAVVPAASDYDADQIDYDNSTSGLAATDAQAALDEIEGRLDTVEAAGAVDSFNTRTGAVVPAASDYDADQIDYDNTISGLVATDAQAAIDEVENDISNHLGDFSVHGVSGNVVGNTDTQIITNKDIDGGTASNTSRITLPKETKANLDSLTRKEGTVVYASDEDVVYYDDGTALQPVGSGAGGSGNDLTSPTNFNYIANFGAEEDVTGWTKYRNSVAANKPDDFGSPAGALLFLRATSNVLTGAGDFQFQKSAANFQGYGVYYEFTPEIGHKGSMMLFSMLLDNTNLVDDDISIWLVGSDDSFVSDFEYVSPANPDVVSSTKIHKQLQLGSKAEYRLCVHYNNTETTSKIFHFDQVFLGPSSVATGTYQRTEAIDLDGDFTAGEILLSRAGNIVSLELSVQGTFTSANSAETSSGFLPIWARPSTRKTNIYKSTTAQLFTLTVESDGTFSISFSTEALAASPRANTLGTDASISYTVLDGISDVRMSEDLGQREISVTGVGSSGSAFTSTVTNLEFTETRDTSNSWDGRIFTAPESGTYEFTGQFSTTAGTTGAMRLYVNGTDTKRRGQLGVSSIFKPFHFVQHLEKGDTAAIRTDVSGTQATFGTNNYIEINKYANSQALLETETVAAKYETNSGQTVTSSGVTTIVYEDKEHDTHNAYNISTGVYTAPVSGDYLINASYVCTYNLVAGEKMSIRLYFNGVVEEDNLFESTGTNSTTGMSLRITSMIKMEKGDEFYIAGTNGSGANVTIATTTYFNKLSIARIK